MNSTKMMLVFILSTAVLIFTSCKDDYEKLLKETSIKNEFATNSPVTKEITLQLLDKPNQWGNFKMTANLKGQLKDDYLAYEVDEQKVVMRDDGKGADTEKGDGNYSVYVTIDTNEVKGMVSEQNASLSRGALLEKNIKDVKDILTYLKFDSKDSARSEASHLLLRNDPNFDFLNRFVIFNKLPVPGPEEVLILRRPIHFFPRALCPPPPADIIPKSLMINDLSVVEDLTRTWNPVTHTGNKNGAWTFNNIINQMTNKAATGVSATQFVLSWLQTWDNNITMNGDVAGQRAGGIDAIISNWKQRSLAHGLPADSLDMAEAPVKLLAIVNRVDLRQNTGYSSTNAGEGRFVFGVLNSDAAGVQNSQLSFKPF